MVENM
jgi:hypothetical protein